MRPGRWRACSSSGSASTGCGAARGLVRRPQRDPVRQPQPRRPCLPALVRRPLRRSLLAPGERDLALPPPGAFRPPGAGARRRRQPHDHGGSARHARHRRRRDARWRWRWPASPSRSSARSSRASSCAGGSRRGCSRRTSCSSCSAAAACGAGRAAIFEFFGDGVAGSPRPTAGRSATWSWRPARRPGSSPATRGRGVARRPGPRGGLGRAGADEDAAYDELEVIELDALEPLIASPRRPATSCRCARWQASTPRQVCVGSSVNSSYEDLAVVAAVLRGRTVPDSLDLTVTPGSRQILDQIVRGGVYSDLLAAGARFSSPPAAPASGWARRPRAGAVSVRTFNRNFPGRSGTPGDRVYLCSPATAAATALGGAITDPRELGEPPDLTPAPAPDPSVGDGQIVAPALSGRRQLDQVEHRRPPEVPPLPEEIDGRILIVVPDDVSTGDLAPDGALGLAIWSNIPACARYMFRRFDPEFAERAQEWGGGIVVAGHNYGQGSSREQAAFAALHLGIRAVVAKGFARIHRSNLIAQGILPSVRSSRHYERVEQGQVGDPGRPGRERVEAGPRPDPSPRPSPHLAGAGDPASRRAARLRKARIGLRMISARAQRRPDRRPCRWWLTPSLHGPRPSRWHAVSDAHRVVAAPECIARKARRSPGPPPRARDDAPSRASGGASAVARTRPPCLALPAACSANARDCSRHAVGVVVRAADVERETDPARDRVDDPGRPRSRRRCRPFPARPPREALELEIVSASGKVGSSAGPSASPRRGRRGRARPRPRAHSRRWR